MKTLLSVIYIASAIPTIGGITILVVLAPKPTTVYDHLQGLARYLMLAGVGFHAARVLSGRSPQWEIVALMLGLGIGMTHYARQNHLIAKAREHLTRGQEVSA
jgi:hypothetical protein